MLTGCNVFGLAGPQNELPELPERAFAPCASPLDYFPGGAMSAGDTEIDVGRMGDALLICGREKAALAAWGAGVLSDFGG